MSLYLWLALLAVSIPLFLSFEKNLLFYKRWPFLFSAIFFVMIPFLAWDIYFTKNGYWGFNPEYLIGATISILPIEEILFFIVVPYASLFAYYAIRFHFPKYKLKNELSPWITGVLCMLALMLIILNTAKIYTVINFVAFAFTLLFGFFKARETLSAFYAIYPVLLVPFFIMNGILTGTGIDGEVVWYNESAFMGKRILTIPVEDFFYAFTLIFLVLLLTERLQKAWEKKR